MKFGQVFFRKMTILYSIIIGIMIFSIYFIMNDAASTSVEIDTLVRQGTIIASSNKELDSIKNAEIIDKVKEYKYILKVDTSLSGNECLADSDLYLLHDIGDTLEIGDDGNHTCVIKSFVKWELKPYDLAVSKELYESITDNEYQYLISVKTYGDYNKIEGEEDIIGLSMPNMENEFYYLLIKHDFDLYIVGGYALVLFLLVFVLFFNTKGYIKAHAKQTRKKTTDSTFKLTIGSTILTIVTGYIIGGMITGILVLIEQMII